MVISVVVFEDEDFCFRPRCKSKKAFFSEEKKQKTFIFWQPTQWVVMARILLQAQA